jgi:hypothetical protein
VDLRRRVAHLQLLDVGVDRDELDLRDPGVHHPVERVHACAPDPDDADHREVGAAVARTLEAGRVLGERLEPVRRRRRRDDPRRLGREQSGRLGVGRDHALSGHALRRRAVARHGEAEDRVVLSDRGRPWHGRGRVDGGPVLRGLGRTEELGQWALTHA